MNQSEAGKRPSFKDRFIKGAKEARIVHNVAEKAAIFSIGAMAAVAIFHLDGLAVPSLTAFLASGGIQEITAPDSASSTIRK